ncbi:MAG: HYR domain-containing protein, partial [Phycisphaerae bacterium]|nr:HYR domain-containing protein [Phycisphaerae bacterium]NIP56071.1 HYR domain-containing protein [Phycisphaerae bacterium]NIS51631.1 HYR domain-containing protein [Phycisphaerae bacterium]NIU09225.1 HYR domain-containing protein [Phycisphaerae bacterium]NIU56886.1 HYR domain-containing protein [Phycisphaerae bacterium]
PADVSLSPTDLGCVVTFNTAATAIDECDQAPQITSDPPLPATFEEIGEHTITFTATDSCGNSSQCSMTVTVLPTAYCLKQEAIAVLEGLLSKDQGDDDLIQAIGYLYMSLGDNVMAKAVADMDGSEVVWASPNRIAECQGGYKGADVFQYEQGACDKLDAYIDNDENTGFGFGAEIETVRQMMAEADQILAATAISDAHANSGNTDAIADAESLKDEGDAAKAIGGTEICDIALDKYEEAWEKAVGSWGCD